MNTCVVGVVISQYCSLLLGVGVEPGVVVSRMGLDTLLSFEESAGRAPLFLVGCGVLGDSGLHRLLCWWLSRMGWLLVLVGWLFVNWIVDASICGSSSPGAVTS